jgi:hypothetical protein
MKGPPSTDGRRRKEFQKPGVLTQAQGGFGIQAQQGKYDRCVSTANDGKSCRNYKNYRGDVFLAPSSSLDMLGSAGIQIQCGTHQQRCNDGIGIETIQAQLRSCQIWPPRRRIGVDECATSGRLVARADVLPAAVDVRIGTILLATKDGRIGTMDLRSPPALMFVNC